MNLNGSLFEEINELAGHVSLADRGMEFAAQYAVIAIAFIVAGSWFTRAGHGADRRIAVYTAIAAAAISLGIALFIQHYYVHQRPFVLRTGVVLLMDHGADPSFPSEHSTAAFAGDVAAGAAIGVLVAVALWSARPALAWLDSIVVSRAVPAPLR